MVRKKRLKPYKLQGNRFKEICGEIFANMSRRKIADELEATDGAVKGWEEGADINCKALAILARLGGDVLYILTGEKSTTMPPPAARMSAAQKNAVHEIHAGIGDLLGLCKMVIEDPAEGERLSRDLHQATQKILSTAPAGARRNPKTETGQAR